MKQDSFSKKYIKSHLGTAYSIARSIRDMLKNEKIKKISKIEDNSTHATDIAVNAPIKKLYVEPAVKRLNIVVSKLDNTLSNTEKDLLIEATRLANDKKYELRIISRNNIPDPKFYKEILFMKNLKIPKKISFYTDWYERMSPLIYALEVTSGDIFFVDVKELKEWGGKNE